MTQKDKELLLKDLSARLPFGIRCSFGVDDAVYEITGINPKSCGASEIQATHVKSGINGDFSLSSCKPYLFPMLSMTEEQKNGYYSLCNYVPTYHYEYGDIVEDIEYHDNWESIDYLIVNHFDYRGLIPLGLANDATGLNIY